MAAAASVPIYGDFLQDGTRLVEVVGIDAEGRYMVEDALTGTLMTIPAEELSDWTAVPRD